MVTMLCDSGLLCKEKPKKGKHFRLALPLSTVQEFFETSRLFTGMMSSDAAKKDLFCPNG